MSRRVKIRTREKGEIEVLLIWANNGVWESEWEPLRATPWGSMIEVVPAEVVEHALHGWSKPLTSALGIQPSGALRKVPAESRQCAVRLNCALHDSSKCFPAAKELPLCFEPAGLENDAQRMAASRLVQAWHEGVYVVVTNAD